MSFCSMIISHVDHCLMSWSLASSTASFHTSCALIGHLLIRRLHSDWTLTYQAAALCCGDGVEGIVGRSKEGEHPLLVQQLCHPGRLDRPHQDAEGITHRSQRQGWV